MGNYLFKFQQPLRHAPPAVTVKCSVILPTHEVVCIVFTFHSDNSPSQQTRFSAMATSIVLCDVRTDYARFTQTHLISSNAVAHVSGRWLLTAENRVRSQASQCAICGRQNDTRREGFLSPPGRCTSIFRSQYLFINPPCPSTTPFYSYEKDKWAKPGNLRTKPCGFGHRGERWPDNYFPVSAAV